MKKVGLMTTWKTECGLAFFAEFMPVDRLIAEVVHPPCSNFKASSNRTWSRFEKLDPKIIPKDVDVLHVNMEWGLIYQNSPLPFFKQIRKRVKLLATMHSVMEMQDMDYYKDLLNCFDQIIVQNKPMQKELRKLYGLRSTIIPLGVIRKKHREERPIHGTYCGMMGHGKGLLELAHAVEETKIPFKFIGHPLVVKENDANNHFANELEKVHPITRKWMTTEELLEEWSRSAFAVFNYQSKVPSCSGVVAAAMGAGVPCISTNVPMCSALTNKNSIKVKSSKELKTALISLYKNREMRKILSRKVSNTLPTWGEIGLMYKEIYQSMV